MDKSRESQELFSVEAPPGGRDGNFWYQKREVVKTPYLFLGFVVGMIFFLPRDVGIIV